MGTWWYDKDLSAVVTVQDNRVVTVADFGKVDNAEENGRLISSAPELLEVTQSILADDMLQYLPVEYVSKVRAAIAKATGAAEIGKLL